MDVSTVKFEEIVIAAWLHDVGKFAQRADIKELFDKANREGQLCKVHDGGWYSHQHVIYTEGFLEKYRDILPDGINVVNVIHLAANHHNPSSYEEWLIAQGDRLSSGSERCNIWKDAKQNDDEIKMKFYEKPMIHILSTLCLSQDNSTSKKQPITAYCNLTPLEGKAILSSTTAKISQKEYADLWHKFEEDFAKLKGLSFDDFILSLNSLLERYWWCIPSATNCDSDISLYQHAKTTAAFASALYRYQKDSKTETINDLENNEEKKFCFINGDISGIQKYIFDLKTTEDNAKLLRAKSFQLWALSEILSQFLVKQFDLTHANIITSAGGKFIILVPNSEKAKQLLPQLQCEIEEYILKEYAGKLSVIISDGVEASQTDVQKDNAQNLINQIGEKADWCKQRKMQKALQKNGAILTAFYDELQKNGECPKCGSFPASSLGSECPNCKKLTEIGSQLVKASVIQIDSSELKHFGEMVHIKKGDSSFGYSVNKYVAGKPVMYLPYIAPWVDEVNSKLKTFEDIANESTGNKKLAMFKADIDNLGLIFSSSLGKRMSFSRYADMSHILHYFFSTYFAWFVSNNSDQKKQLYKDTIYTVFSGGDDLCILGSWDSVMQFASDFKKELDKLTNNNPDITISGGIILTNSNVPVRNIASSAEEELEKSKGYLSKDSTEKNAITVFDTTVSWKEYDECLENGKQIQSYFDMSVNKEKPKVSTGVVYKMLDFANRAKKVKNGNIKELLNNIHNGIWLSNYHYVISRNINDKEISEWFLAKFGNQEKMINSRIAVSYALYTQRNN